MHTECQNYADGGGEVSGGVARKLLFINGLKNKVDSLLEASSYPRVACANFCMFAGK
jgi:hypothetical protein